MSKGRLVPGSEFRIHYPGLHAGQELVNAEADAALMAADNACSFYLCAHRGWWKSSLLMRRLLLFLKKNIGPAAWYAPAWKTIDDTQENLFKKALGKENWRDWYQASENILRIPGCPSVHFYSLDRYDNAAGPTFAFMAGDEWGSLADNVQEAIIDPIIEKAYASYKYAEAWFTGTPNRTGNPHNDFYHNITEALKGEDEGAKAWVIPYNAKIENEQLIEFPNPYANTEYSFQRLFRMYKKAKRKKTWRIEWLCEFISDEGGQFELEAIESQCVLDAEPMLVPITDTSYLRKAITDPEIKGKSFTTYRLRGYSVDHAEGWYQIGIDVGISNDRVSIWIMDKKTCKQIYFHHFLPSGKDRWFMLYEAIALAVRYVQGADLYIDTGGAGASVPSTMERNYGIFIPEDNHMKFTRHNKASILDHASSLLENKQTWLFNLDIIKSELKTMQRKATASGVFQIAAAKDAHDDAPIGYALSVHGLFPTMQYNDKALSDMQAVAFGTSVFMQDSDDIHVSTLGLDDYAFLSEYASQPD